MKKNYQRPEAAEIDLRPVEPLTDNYGTSFGYEMGTGRPPADGDDLNFENKGWTMEEEQ